MIIGAHTIVHAHDPDTARAFLRDVLGWSNVDAGGGWLIFRAPPSEVAVHPAGEPESGRHELYLVCDDLAVTMAELSAKGVEFGEVHEERWGSLTRFTVPGVGPMGLYQPKHPLAFER